MRQRYCYMSIRGLRILLDCDGILADFCQSIFDLIEAHCGDVHTLDQVSENDIFEALGKGHLKHLFTDAVARPGWVAAMKPYAGSHEMVKELERRGEVVIVTSPMLKTPSRWTYERNVWLMMQYGIPKTRIVYADSKHYVDGDVFIDDTPEHCRAWSSFHPRALTLLWDRPYNRAFESHHIKRVFNAVDAIEAIDNLISERGIEAWS